ncbi:hypothetical protein K7432_015597 [Basidiobolus ranarum]|uniref:NADP-dependent oxidoreductase domain-containing protein n=1 Tax=Basidiobolus ranarum TaxID=34480 RepID=A0ABR2VN33_9FUNG
MAKAPRVFPLVGGRRVEQLQGNIEALNIKLTSEQIEYLESINSFDVGFPNEFVGPDPKITGKFTGLTAACAALAIEQDPKPIGHA